MQSLVYRVVLVFAFLLATHDAARAEEQDRVPDGVVFPGAQWEKISHEQAGLNVEEFNKILESSHVHAGGWGGTEPKPHQHGAVLTRGGYLIQTWGDPKYRYQSASLGKCITRVLVGLSVEAGLLKLDEPISKTWTGHGELSHPHKYLDAGHHAQLTWRQLVSHQGGFVLESGYHWRTRTLFHAKMLDGVQWTGDPSRDNYAHFQPGVVTQYSSGGYWRLGQALTALWDKDLKQVLQDRLFSPMDIPADRWDWLPGKVVHDTKDFYPSLPGYGEYVDPPYEINGHTVRGAPGWFVISSEDLARFGLLVATRGIWKGQRLIGAEWLQGHSGVGIHVVAGDPETLVSIAMINTAGFPFGKDVGTQGRFSFPEELVVGPVAISR